MLVFSGSNQPASLSGKTVGVVNLLGHHGTQAFAVSLLKTSDFKVKLVAKVEDLLALLEFSAADAILIPGTVVKRLTERTRLLSRRARAPGRPRGAAQRSRCCTPRIGTRSFGPCAPSTRETKNLLGIDSWSPR